MERQKWFLSKKFIGFLTSLALLLSVAVTPMAASPVGDLNGDNIVSAPDLATLTTVIITGNKDIAYDVNGDGLINILDLVRLKKKLAFAITTVTLPVVPVDGKVPEGGLTLAGGGVSAFVPEGVLLEDGVDSLTLTVTPIISPSDDVEVSENENITSYDVHISGISKENTVPIIVELGAVMPKFLNIGNYRIYHLENGEKVLMTLVDSKEELTAHNQFTYEPETGKVTVAMATFSEVAMIADNENVWNGNITAFNKGDGSEENPYIVSNADQLAYLNDRVSNDNENYGDKHYKLIADLYFGGESAENIWYPIGYWAKGEGVNTVGETWYTFGGAFGGTFDGNGHEISGIHQNTWSMDGDFEDGYWDAAMGLFGYVENGTVKNLTVDSFTSDGEFTPTGVISAYAVNSTFENIALTNCNPRVYNTGNGGIVGIGGNNDDTEDLKLTFTNITIDNSNKISALWGSWDVACGGLVGMFRGAGHVYMTNCHVAAQIDVNNDVCGNYQYYWYRYAGMMIGTNKNMITENGKTLPETSKYHAEGCTVHFGDWNDYYYCELVDNTLASYTHDHQFSRLQKVKAVNGTTITYLDDTQAEVPESGRYNYVVVNGEASTANATCYHFKDGAPWSHEDGGYETTDIDGDGVVDSDVLKEDKQHIYLPFNQLFTGYGWGVNHIPVYNGKEYAFEGITILDRVEATSDDKFAIADNAETAFTTGVTVKIGDLFKDNTEVGTKNPILSENVKVFVSPVDESSNVSATYSANTSDWKQGTLTFTGLGVATVSITDYYFCNTATISVTISEPEDVEKFVSTDPKTIVLANGDNNVVSLGELFTAVDSVEIDSANVTVTVTTSDGDVTGEYNADSNDWKNGTVSFTGNGTAVVTITDNNYCIEASNTVKLDSANKVKFAAIENVTVEDILTDDTVALSEIFNATGNADIKDDSVTITVSGVDYVLTENASDWTQSTIKFSGIGTATITITDGFYCEEATNTVTVKVVEIEKFDLVFENTAKYLYRVGNASGSTVKLATLFNDSGKGTIGTPAVTFETVSGDATGTFTSNATWTNGTIQFSGTGVVKVSVTDNNYCIPTDLYLEVVNAKNVTSAISSSGTNIVLLSDVQIASGSNVTYTNCFVYGNGFTFNVKGGMTQYSSKQGWGIINLNGGVTLDNLVIIGDDYNAYGAYSENEYNTAAVASLGGTIQNCYIHGCATPVMTRASTTIVDTTLHGGSVANLIIKSGVNTLENVTTVNYEDGREFVGMGIVAHSDIASEDAASLVLNGTLKQYNFISDSYVPNDDNAKELFNAMFSNSCSNFHFETESGKFVNTGIISMTDKFTVEYNIKDNANTGYTDGKATIATSTSEFYSQPNTLGSVDNGYVEANDTHKASVQGDYLPTPVFDLGTQAVEGEERYLKGNISGVEARFVEGEAPFNLDITKLMQVYKYNNEYYDVTAACYDSNGNALTATNGVITLDTTGNYTLKFTVNDDIFYSGEGAKLNKSVERIYEVPLVLAVAPPAIADAVITINNASQSGSYSGIGDKTITFNPLNAITITDAEGTVDLTANIASTNIVYASSSSAFAGTTTITVTYNDGRILKIVLGKPNLNSPGSSKAITYANDGTIKSAGAVASKSATGGTWTVTSYSFKGTNGKTITNNTVVTYTFPDKSCVTGDTLVMLADGTQKRIDEITYSDELLVWNFFEGKYDVVPSAIIFYHGDDLYDVLTLNFEDGTSVRTINVHGFFDADLNEFVFIEKANVEEYIGHNFVKVDGSDYTSTKLIGYTVTEEYTGCYSIQSAKYNNFITEGMFSITIPAYEGWFDYFEIGDNMKYDEAKMQADIEKYGLYEYEELAEYVTYEQFIAFNGPYLKVLVGKGIVTFDDIINLISTYVKP